MANEIRLPLAASNLLPRKYVDNGDGSYSEQVSASVSATTEATATAAAPTYVEGTDNPLSMDLAGGLRVTGTINATSAATATAAAPSYGEGDPEAFSQNLSGDLRVIAKQSGTWNVGLSTGANLIGSVAIDQTTPGTTNAVDATNFPVTVDTDAGAAGASTLRVAIATGGATPLPTGAATAAKQPALGTAGTASADVISVQGIASMTPLLVTPAANSAVNVAQINGVTTLMGNGATGTGSQRVTLSNDNTGIANWGHGAVAAAVPAGAQYNGLLASTANPSAATAGNMVGAMADKLGRQVVVIGNVRDLKLDAQLTLTSTTTETTLLAAAASTFHDMYGCIIENISATACEVEFRDDTAGTLRFSIYVPAGDTRGFMLPSSDAYKQAVVNKNWTAKCITSVASIKISALFVKNT